MTAETLPYRAFRQLVADVASLLAFEVVSNEIAVNAGKIKK